MPYVEIPKTSITGPERNELEAAHAEVVISRPRTMAGGTHRFGTAPRTHVDFNGLALAAQSCRVIDEAGKMVALVQNRDQPHDKDTEGKMEQHLSRGGLERLLPGLGQLAP
jgi:hypothetical protein